MATIRANRHGNLVIDFTYKHKRHVYSTGYSDNKANRKKVSHIKGGIEHGVNTSTLDLSKYFPRAAKPVSTKSLEEFFDYHVSEKTLRYNSMRGLCADFKNHIQPFFCGHKWNDIDDHEVKVFRVYLQKEKKLKSNTINKIMIHLSGIFSHAFDKGLLPKYPCKKLGKLTEERTKINPFSLSELKHFLNWLLKNKPEYHDMIYIWSQCGFRHGEILALQWGNLDYYNKTLYVESTLLDNGTLGVPKTRSSQRHIPLTDEVIEAFKRQEKRSRMASEFIFPDPYTNARYVTTNSFLKRFRWLLTLAGLKLRPPNQLRHTFVTLALASGEDIGYVSAMVGHKDSEMTFKKYHRYIPNVTRKDGSALSKAFKSHRNSDLSVTQVDK